MRSKWSGYAAVFAFFLNAPAYNADASERPYRVGLSTERGAAGDVVTISFETVEQFPTMCGLTTTRFEVTRPERSVDNDLPSTPGTIAFDTKLIPGILCLLAYGPHRGGIDLTLGDRLPALPDGYYLLTIDGTDYDRIWVHQGNVAFLEGTEGSP